MFPETSPIVNHHREPFRAVGGRLPALALLLCLAAAPAASQAPGQIQAVDYCSATPLTNARKVQLRERLEDRTGTPPTERAVAALTLAGDTVAAAEPSARACEKAFSSGQKTFDRELRKQARKVKGDAGDADSADSAIRAVQQQLRDAFIADQAARRTYLELITDDRQGAAYWASRLSMANAVRVDAANKALLKSLLADYDWIDAQRFGNRIASHAWVIAQHADADPEFQKDVLARMQPYLETGGIRKRDYAYLYDRVAVNTGALQRYGTQPMETCNADGSLSPKPLEDPQSVDERRAELGMEPMNNAMANMASHRC